MSYSCTISFKQVSGDGVFEFLQDFKKKCCESLEKIAKEEFAYSPIYRAYHFEDSFSVTDEMRRATETWAKQSIFHFRFFYNKDLQLLGIYGVYDCLEDMFDASVYFQNSCDQDYDFDTWKGIKCFEAVAEKWKNASEENAKEYYAKHYGWNWDESEPFDLDYYRRSFAYDEIWRNFKNTLYDDSSALYLSLFGFYDILEMKSFVKFTEEAAKKRIEEWNKEFEKEKEKEK